MQPMLIEKSIFNEDDVCETAEIAKSYFDVKIVTWQDVIDKKYEKTELFRGSLGLGIGLKKDFKPYNALEFMPAMREFLVSERYKFLDMASIRDYEEFPKFIRPCSGLKEFAGNVYTKESFDIEYRFAVNNRNNSPGTICVVSSPVKINREWRCIFVDNKLISGSQYMQNAELSVFSELPNEVQNYAKTVYKHDYFLNLPEIVLDIAETQAGLRLIEINAFETSSWYGADRHEILNALKSATDLSFR